MAMYGEEYFNNHAAGIAMTNIIANNMNLNSFKGIILILFSELCYNFFVLYFNYLMIIFFLENNR
jgi:hypothetical protein